MKWMCVRKGGMNSAGVGVAPGPLLSRVFENKLFSCAAPCRHIGKHALSGRKWAGQELRDEIVQTAHGGHGAR